MKSTLIILIATGMIACDANQLETEEHIIIPLPKKNPALIAFNYINYTEDTHTKELSTLTGVDVTHTEWCAAFVNGVLDQSSIPNNSNHKFPLTAKGFLDWGVEVNEPKPGDLIIFPRGDSDWQGHVGFYLSTIIINNVM